MCLQNVLLNELKSLIDSRNSTVQLSDELVIKHATGLAQLCREGVGLDERIARAQIESVPQILSQYFWGHVAYVYLDSVRLCVHGTDQEREWLRAGGQSRRTSFLQPVPTISIWLGPSLICYQHRSSLITSASICPRRPLRHPRVSVLLGLELPYWQCEF